jgi:hypothetical protein
VELIVSCGARVRFWADMAHVTGLVGGLLRSYWKNSPTIGFSGSNGLREKTATTGQGETTESGFNRGDGV